MNNCLDNTDKERELLEEKVKKMKKMGIIPMIYSYKTLNKDEEKRFN